MYIWMGGFVLQRALEQELHRPCPLTENTNMYILMIIITTTIVIIAVVILTILLRVYIYMCILQA